MTDAELDDMLNGLDEIEVSGTGGNAVRLPAKWGEAEKKSSVQRRHGDQEVAKLLSSLDRDPSMPRAQVPHMDAVKVTTAGPCAACHAEIEDANYSSTGGSKFHDLCFKCSRCNGQISGACEMEGSRLICSSCVSLPKCKRCGTDIGVTDKFVSPDDNVKYHSGRCTTCASCRTTLDLNDVFFLKGDLYCKQCA